MLRGLSRAVGYMLLAGSFITLVVDGTRSIAASALVLTPLQGLLDRVFPTASATLRTTVAPIHPFLWDPVALTGLQAPLAVVLLALGLVFVVIASGGRDPEPGYLSRR